MRSSGSNPSSSSGAVRRGWLDNLMTESFYETCDQKHDPSSIDNKLKNKKVFKNVYCLVCCISIRPYCRHDPSHSLLKVRHCNQNHAAVQLIDLDKLIDCSDIKVYTHNNLPVIALNPGSQKTSSPSTKCMFCHYCGRVLRVKGVTNTVKFCSLSCKVENHTLKEGKPLSDIVRGFTASDRGLRNENEEAPIIPTSSRSNLEIENEAAPIIPTSSRSNNAEATTTGCCFFRRKKRKGVPHRAALP